MTSNQLKKLADKYGLDLKYVTSWTPPTNGDMRPLIAMPNIPKPLHGEGCQPRTIYRPKDWNAMRRGCYEKANDTCEICGECPEDKRRRQAHEIYVIDYEHGTSTFVGCVCLDTLCHLACIHNGRALTLWSKGSPLSTKEFLLDGAEHAFKIISEYNKDNPGADLRAYSTYVEYLKHDELREPMLELIKKYGIKLYMEDPKKIAKWSEWKLILDGKEYPTPYKNEKEWKKAMEEKSYNDTFGKGIEVNVKPLTTDEVAEEHNKLKNF